MSNTYAEISTRTNADANASSDINQIQNNFNAVLIGNKRFSQMEATLCDIKQNATFVNSTVTAGLYASGSKLKYAGEPLDTQGISFSIPSELTTGENKIIVGIPKAFEIKHVKAGITTAPVGATLAIDINYHATDITSMTTIFTTQANKPQIAGGANVDTSETPDVTTIAAGGFMSISIDTVGSATPGTNLACTVVTK